jgi:hypothetical protein
METSPTRSTSTACQNLWQPKPKKQNFHLKIGENCPNNRGHRTNRCAPDARNPVEQGLAQAHPTRPVRVASGTHRIDYTIFRTVDMEELIESILECDRDPALSGHEITWPRIKDGVVISVSLTQ